MPDRPVVLNNTPLVAFWILGRFDLLRALAYAELDQGEAEVLALAEEQDARLVIIDERKGRRYAERMRLPRTGSLGVLLLSKQAGLIDSVAASIAKLQEAGLFLSPELIRRTLEIAGESI